jgi:hypothetical protein
MPPVPSAPRPARVAPSLRASRGPSWGAKMDDIEDGVSKRVPRDRARPTRVAAVVDTDADGVDADREGVEPVLRHGWAGGSGRRTR